MSKARIHRRRRTVAMVATAAVVAIVAIAVGKLTGGAAVQRLEAATFPTQVATDWARDREARRQAVADQQALESVLRTTPVVREGGGEEPLVALTFDDGPSQYTEDILEILDHYEAPATFFVIGGAHERSGMLMKEVAARGHVVANHTVNHPGLEGMPAREQAEEIDGESRAIEMFLGQRPRLFRPPYNLWDERTAEIASRRGMVIVLWSVESNDWTLPGAAAITETVVSQAHPGAIVLMHDGGGDRSQTVAALPDVIEGLREKGLELVTVPRLLREDPPGGQTVGTSP